jgi:hypothetical protein
MHKRITVSGDREEMNMEELANEFEAWKGEQGFADEYDANELLMMDGLLGGFRLTGEQRDWLKDFERRWDRQQALVDRLVELIERPYV